MELHKITVTLPGEDDDPWDAVYCPAVAPDAAILANFRLVAMDGAVRVQLGSRVARTRASAPASCAVCRTMLTYENAEVTGFDGFGPCPPPIFAGGGHQSPYGVCMLPSPPAACEPTLPICSLSCCAYSTKGRRSPSIL